jgi:hypothetical protein
VAPRDGAAPLADAPMSPRRRFEMNNRILDDPYTADVDASDSAIVNLRFKLVDWIATKARDQDDRFAKLSGRRAIIQGGLALALGGVGALEAAGAQARKTSLQSGWHACYNCSLLWLGDAGQGRCPGATPYFFPGHAPAGSYLLHFDEKVKHEQRGWRYCVKCASLWFAGADSNGGVCAAGGGHSQDGSNFSVRLGKKKPHGYEDYWRCCAKCSGLWNSNYYADPCPAGGDHSDQASGKYYLRVG